jgi:hypothetical protein
MRTRGSEWFNGLTTPWGIEALSEQAYNNIGRR